MSIPGAWQNVATTNPLANTTAAAAAVATPLTANALPAQTPGVMTYPMQQIQINQAVSTYIRDF